MSESKENKKESTTSKKERQSTPGITTEGKNRVTLVEITGEETDEDLDKLADDMLAALGMQVK